LDGDDLHIDGQAKGRTDAMLIEHLERGLEVLLFYRSSKAENPGYAFRYEGEFRYVEHTGARPARFHFHQGPFQSVDARCSVRAELPTHSITEVALAINRHAPHYEIG
jgi:putative restriction endonuclease